MRVKSRLRKAPYTKRQQIVGGVIVVLLLAVLTGTLYARYIKSQEQAGTVTAKEFYFTSDYLRNSAEPMKTHKLNSGETSVTFEVNNFADALRVSDVDIKYTVTVKDSLGNIIDSAGSTGKLDGGSAATATVSINGLTAGKKYLVTVDGVGGYRKTLQATVEVGTPEAGVYKQVANFDEGVVKYVE